MVWQQPSDDLHTTSIQIDKALLPDIESRALSDISITYSAKAASSASAIISSRLFTRGVAVISSSEKSIS